MNYYNHITCHGTSKKNNRHVPSGIYTSTITKVEFDPDYVEGSVLKISYQLLAADGSKYKFCERFYLIQGNVRTEALYDYLEENSVNDTSEGLPDLVGAREKIEIKKNPTSSGALPTIVSRRFISEDASNTTAEDKAESYLNSEELEEDI